MNATRYWLLVLLPFTISFNIFGQEIPILKSHTYNISIRDGDDFRKGRWNIDPKVNPDIYEAPIAIDEKYKLVTFITDVDSLQIRVEKGKTYPFLIIVNEKDSAFTQVRTVKSAVNFNKDYIRSHEGKTFVEIPDVYELVNIIIALTSTGKNNDGLVAKNTAYYKEVMNWFGKYEQEPVIMKIDSVLSKSYVEYFSIKMNAYSFNFNSSGKIVQNPIYDRLTSVNSLRPYLKELQSFSDKSKFEHFFKQNQLLYNQQISTYRDSTGLMEMQKWLGKNFPKTKYNSYKIVFSPLVGNNQSANWYEYNGFKEVQAHVNFPYRREEEKGEFSSAALHVKDGNIVFTELNHNFIGPEIQKSEYQKGIKVAFEKLDTWIENGSPAERAYNNARACFDEYMNWALVSLRYIDYAPPGEQDKLILKMEKYQVEVRGFKKFAEFDQFLIQLYKKRKVDQVVADLYPQIVEWFVKNK
ncbi:DUF4932 domain-containing protein [Dyadobacter chenwenxiniae]|uniref:DUF4932 domain-containing protein n=1 Tax=Dyadobacter chenwenxiniae TaxID=2906456 RepID=A0A9X1PHY7_9BACT|nr:DUF4932 domain-containing protein [Dyadobacter chenwenxiniae]MCF0060224.1 DUF4932 domain-containing protein [Dyadobacter chenwenxiniae]UON85961.1 DUF4932 domain-containing protein [Dyadobacter chenwenxiniae]